MVSTIEESVLTLFIPTSFISVKLNLFYLGHIQIFEMLCGPQVELSKFSFLIEGAIQKRKNTRI